MAYQANIPQSTDLLSQSQSDILGNFQAIQTLIDVNHVDFASGDQGKHKWCSFPVQGGNPGTLATEVAVFSRVSTLTTNNELCIQHQSNGSVIEMTSALQNATGWSYLPSGILIKWGAVVAIGSGSQTFSYPTGATIPVFNHSYIVMLQPTSNISVYVTAEGTTTFTYTPTGSGTFNYLTIGN